MKDIYTRFSTDRWGATLPAPSKPKINLHTRERVAYFTALYRRVVYPQTILTNHTERTVTTTTTTTTTKPQKNHSKKKHTEVTQRK